jgi:tetratricopeptide (TPR) repeat protein
MFDLQNAISLHRRGHLLEAERMYRKILKSAPNQLDAQHLLGVVKHQQGRNAEALELISAVLKKKPNEAVALSDYGLICNELNRFDEALASCDKAIALRPDLAIAFNNRGNALRELKRFDEALASYDKAIAIKPAFAAALNNRAFELAELGLFAEARRNIEEAIQQAPRKPLHYLTLGRISRCVAGDPRLTAMEELARDASSLSVRDRIDLHFALAKAYEDLGRPESAFSQLLAGNKLERGQIRYDETATLGTHERLRGVFTPQLLQSFQNVGEPSRLPVFVVGMPRSGTTLIEQILASHPDVFGGGELDYFPKASADLQSGVNGLAVSQELVSSLPGEQFRQIGESYLAKIKQLAPAAARVVDKMPGNYLNVGLIHLALPNASIIHAVRDPVDTCVSCFSKLFADGQLDYTYDLAELGRYYRHYQALMAHWHQVLPPGRILDVRYEEVVADLEGVARRIVAHCGLEWNARCLAFHQTERPIRTASVTQVRQPIYQSSVGRRFDYEAFLAPLLAELGIARGFDQRMHA